MAKVEEYWRGKSVLVTGASSGLGWAITEALAPYGIHFALLSRREERMRELANQLSNTPSRFWIRSVDVRNREQVYRAVRDFAAEAGRLDVAWVNSGIGGSTAFDRWNWDTVEAMIDTNLKGAIYTTMACLEQMVPRGEGAIVGIGSASSMRGLPGRGIYSMTKIALAYYLESLMAELPQIQFTIIHPGFVDTPINQNNPNRFWLMQPPEAAQLMIRAVARRKRVYIYPFKMKLLYRVVHALPPSVYFWIAKKMLQVSNPTGERIEIPSEASNGPRQPGEDKLENRRPEKPD